MPPIAAALLAGLAVLGTAVPCHAALQPAGAAGRVKVSSGEASIVRNGQTLPAPVGADVFESDVVRTGGDGRLAVMLKDETRFALGPNSEVAVAAFAYAPSESRLALTLRVARGVLSYVSGLVAKLAPESVTIQTPTAVIGVRGTHALVRAAMP